MVGQGVVATETQSLVSLCVKCVHAFNPLRYENVTKTKADILDWKYVQKSTNEFRRTCFLLRSANSCRILRLDERTRPMACSRSAWVQQPPMHTHVRRNGLATKVHLANLEIVESHAFEGTQGFAQVARFKGELPGWTLQSPTAEVPYEVRKR